MKRLLTLLLSILCLLSFSAFFVGCQDGDGEGGGGDTPPPAPSQPFEYQLEGNEYTIKGIGQVTGNEITIPDTHEGKPVTKIGKNAFAYGTFTSVILGKNITTVGEKAFYFSELQSVTFDASVTTLEKECFAYSKLKEVTLPTNLTTCGDGVFSRCYYLAKAVVPDTVTKLGKTMFANCGTSSTDKTLIVEGGSGLTEVGENTFQSSALRSITLPDTLQYISAGAFSYSKITEFTVPAGITLLSSEAFANCGELTTIRFNQNLETIGGKAFYCCAKLSNIVWAENGKLQTISSSAFYGCVALTVVEFPDSVKSIGECSFAKCGGLEKVVIGEGMNFIGAGSFAYDYEDYMNGLDTSGHPRMLDYLEFKNPDNWIQSTAAGSTSSTFWYTYKGPEAAAQNYHNRRFFHWLKGEQLPKGK